MIIFYSFENSSLLTLLVKKWKQLGTQEDDAALILFFTVQT